MMQSNSRHVFAAAMPASWLRWTMVGDRFVDVTGYLPSEHVVDTAARRPSTVLQSTSWWFWMNFRASCSRSWPTTFACRGFRTGASPRRAQAGQLSVSRPSVQSE
jgi:hypothetical protein